MSGEPLRLAVLGFPLSYTRSPDLHRAGAAALGLRAESRALPTLPESLGERLRELAGEGCHGCNVSSPLKERALEFMDAVAPAARNARSVNTVRFSPDGSHGETTDGDGFVAWLATVGRAPADEGIVILGAGGAARSLALSLCAHGAGRIVVSARRPGACRGAWQEMAGARLVPWRSDDEGEALRGATVVVNATPLEDPDAIAPLDRVSSQALVVDLRYGPDVTDWVMMARALGREAYDGLGLLVHQARESLRLWTGLEVPVEPLAKAVGWPR